MSSIGIAIGIGIESPSAVAIDFDSDPDTDPDGDLDCPGFGIAILERGVPNAITRASFQFAVGSPFGTDEDTAAGTTWKV